MKRTLLVAALLAATGAANASGLTFVASATATRTETFNNITGIANTFAGTTLPLGALFADTAGTISFTFLGQESGYVDSFHLVVNGTNLLESDPVGTTVTSAVSGGLVDFKFEGISGKFAKNGGTLLNGLWDPGTSIGMLSTNVVTAGAAAGSYDLILGYNDSAGSATLGDWDDFVVGVKFTPAVPEPETYALMLAGLGVMGFLARRRRAD
jgi:hypothetical protein